MTCRSKVEGQKVGAGQNVATLATFSHVYLHHTHCKRVAAYIGNLLIYTSYTLPVANYHETLSTQSPTLSQLSPTPRPREHRPSPCCSAVLQLLPCLVYILIRSRLPPPSSLTNPSASPAHPSGHPRQASTTFRTSSSGILLKYKQPWPLQPPAPSPPPLSLVCQ